MNRRGFFRLVAGAALVPVAARFAPAAPVLYGDGLADDTSAVHALLRGEPVEFGPMLKADGAGWVDNVVRFPHGHYRMTSPLEVKDAADVTFDFGGSRFLADYDDGEAYAIVERCERVAVLNANFQRAPRRSLPRTGILCRSVA